MREQNQPMQLSVVIPARDESRHIAAVVRSVLTQLAGLCTHEVIVVDNGSTDATVELARQAGARVVEAAGTTIAAARNLGAGRGSGSILLFLDGDVYVTERWRRRLPATLESLSHGPPCVTGSRCGVGAHPSWIERAWFAPLATEKANYINSGHLLTQRSLFERIGGFDETLVTGEDAEFSRRARAAGAAIVNDPALHVLHEGYPRSLRDFVRRERWHGKGNFTDLSTALGSRVGQLTICFLAGHLLLPPSLVISSWIPATLLVAALIAICLLSAAAKYGPAPRRLLVNGALYYAYFWGRSLALLDRLFGGRRARSGALRGTPR